MVLGPGYFRSLSFNGDGLGICIDCGDNFVDLGLRNTYALQVIIIAYDLRTVESIYNMLQG